MDDIQIILYILAAVAYFLFMQWRKAFQAPADQDKEHPQPKRPQPQQPQRPATTFEDILRELQPKVEQRKAEFENAKEVVREEVTPLETIRQQMPTYKSYEQLPPKVLSWEKAADAKEALMRSKERRQPVFKAYSQEREEPINRYAKMLRNPATVKDAFILSEIFKRKY